MNCGLKGNWSGASYLGASDPNVGSFLIQRLITTSHASHQICYFSPERDPDNITFLFWQTMIYFYDPIEVEQDQVIEGSVTLTQSKENARFMNIHLEYS